LEGRQNTAEALDFSFTGESNTYPSSFYWTSFIIWSWPGGLFRWGMWLLPL